jgi:hypothetical protein
MIHLDAVQDLNTLYTCFGGGEKGKEQALSFVNNHLIKLIFSCSDNETCSAFSTLLGQYRQLLFNLSLGYQRPDQQTGVIDSWLGATRQPHVGYSEQWAPLVRPEYFSGGFLRTGGPNTAPPWSVDAILYIANRQFRNGRAHRLVTFRQVLPSTPEVKKGESHERPR